MKSNELNQTALHVFMTLLFLVCLVPFLLIFMASLTSEEEIVHTGYTLFPKEISLEAYTYLFGQGVKIARAYAITILVTTVGTGCGLLISTMLAYPLSRSDMPARGKFSFIVFFTLLFNGGLVPTYLLYTDYLAFKDTIFALIVPWLLTNGFFILLLRNFFGSSIPIGIIESAYIDGASEFKIFYKMVLPLSLPILATIGLMMIVQYWNDWFNGLVFIADIDLFSIQVMLNRMLMNLQFLQQHSTGGYSSTNNLPLNSVRMAMAVIGILPLLCIYPFLQKYFIKGLTVGAVKG